MVLMDEPTSALDPISTAKIEDLIDELKKKYTIVIVTHNMQQAGRISDQTAFFLTGEVVETGPTEKIFYNPQDKRTETDRGLYLGTVRLRNHCIENNLMWCEFATQNVPQ